MYYMNADSLLFIIYRFFCKLTPITTIFLMSTRLLPNHTFAFFITDSGHARVDFVIVNICLKRILLTNQQLNFNIITRESNHS